MKRLILFVVLLINLFSYHPAIFAAGSATVGDPSVYDTIHHGEAKTSPPVQNEGIQTESSSLFPLLIKFIVSFVFVIVLLVGLLRFLSKRTRGVQANGPILPLGGYPIGNNRSVQMILIGQTIYILGVGESITLIRSIPQGEEYQHLLDGYEQQAEGFTTKWFGANARGKWNKVLKRHLQNMDHENGEE